MEIPGVGSLMELSDSSWHFSAERERETKPKLDKAKPNMHMMALSDSSWYLVINLSHTHAHTHTLSLSS